MSAPTHTEAKEQVRAAARIVLAIHEHAASYPEVNVTETARAMGALAVWEALTGKTGDAALRLARRVARER